MPLKLDEVFLDQLILKKSLSVPIICDHCLNIVKTFKNIKERLTHVIRNSASELNDELKKTPTQNSKKRMASTPASELRFKLTTKREPVISCLKLCKRFLKLANSRDQGTLANLKILIQRSNVDGKVKSRFKAHEDFVLTVSHSYFLDYVMKKFDMKDFDDTPTHKLLPENIKKLHDPSKQKICDAIMKEVIADIYIPYETQVPKKMDLKLLIANQAYQCSASLDNNTAVVPLLINGRQPIIQVPVPRLKGGCSVNVNGITIFVQEAKKGQDDLYNYVHNFLQWNMKSTIFRLQRDLPCEADDDNNHDDDVDDDDGDFEQSDQED
ncbi:unnamed protein product [Mytilus coruscus]|uniref:Uncharacterized protein n=1 Tax=Mytilus coruscus TaxID=42192 RepID=A0A6J8DTF2_MYTCO|nr:unnamed protein product [Mytilus coruscus]